MGGHDAAGNTAANHLKDGLVGSFHTSPDQRQIRCIDYIYAFGIGTVAARTLRSEDSPTSTSGPGVCCQWINCLRKGTVRAEQDNDQQNEMSSMFQIARPVHVSYYSLGSQRQRRIPSTLLRSDAQTFQPQFSYSL